MRSVVSTKWIVLAVCLGPFASGVPAKGESSPARDHAVVQALRRLPQGTLDKHPELRPAALRYLEQQVGTAEYIDVARELQILDQVDALTTMLVRDPVDNLAVDAARLLVQGDHWGAIESVVNADDIPRATSAIRALGNVNQPRVRNLLLELLANGPDNPQVRIAAVEALGKSEPGQRALLQFAGRGSVPDDIRFALTDTLLGSTRDDIRQAAAQHLEPAATKSAEEIPPIRSLVNMRGNAQQGREIFNTVGTCSKCHQVGQEGKEVGPNLSEIGSKLSREDMFVAILNPNAAVSHNYETYAALDIDGQVTTGLLINRNDQAVTIRDAEGIDRIIPLTELEELKQQSVSLMPADIQKTMSLQNLIDVVDYLVSLRKPDDTPRSDIATLPQADSHDPHLAVAGFEIAEGLQVELFASEPMLLSPTSIDVDYLGRIWICEAVNYRHFRNPDNPQRAEGDRILVLEDTDGDGHADRRTVFYQGTDIDSPHGVCVLGEQIIVSAGENVIVFVDSNGDLTPESRHLLFTGIGGVQHDHGIHAFRNGPDGRLYFNFGNEGKQLKSASGETLVDLAGNVVDSSRNPYQEGMVFRCNLDGSQLETLGWNFRNNWELCLDSFGNIWQSDNDDDGNRGTRINFVMEFGNYGFKDERTGDAWRVPRIGMESEIPLQHWHLNDPGVVPNILQTGAGSPTGIFFYEGELLPEPFQNQILHTDPGPNVVRAYPVEPDGAGYVASIRNLVQGVRDPWFRPVDVCAAPDGSLFIADWYDPGVGGHRMGDAEHGRIFRIVPRGHQGYVVPQFDFQTPTGAAAALTNPNLAVRFLAQQALQRLGADAVPALEGLSRQTENHRLAARALWQLGLISPRPEQYVQQALTSRQADLRIVGVRMARQHNLDIIGIIDQLKHDPSPHVRRELAIALRGLRDPRASNLWVDLALQHDARDRWYVEALGIAADQQWDDFFAAWLRRVGDDWNTPAGRDIVWRSRSPQACPLLAELISEASSAAEQQRYFRAFDFHRGPAKDQALVNILATEEL